MHQPPRTKTARKSAPATSAAKKSSILSIVAQCDLVCEIARICCSKPETTPAMAYKNVLMMSCLGRDVGPRILQAVSKARGWLKCSQHNGSSLAAHSQHFRDQFKCEDEALSEDVRRLRLFVAHFLQPSRFLVRLYQPLVDCSYRIASHKLCDLAAFVGCRAPFAELVVELQRRNSVEQSDSGAFTFVLYRDLLALRTTDAFQEAQVLIGKHVAEVDCLREHELPEILAGWKAPNRTNSVWEVYSDREFLQLMGLAFISNLKETEVKHGHWLVPSKVTES